jgi:acyl-CoA thioesterase FadM
MDETLGGLYTCLLTSGHLGVRLPGLTARLEVDYKKKIPAGTTLLVSTEVESVVDRKVWMKATVSDGQGAVFATGRALFVSPNVTKHLARLGNWKENVSEAVAVQGGRLAVA